MYLYKPYMYGCHIMGLCCPLLLVVCTYNQPSVDQFKHRLIVVSVPSVLRLYDADIITTHVHPSILPMQSCTFQLILIEIETKQIQQKR